MALFTQLRKGSTEIVLLRLLCERPMYGYELAQVLERRSQGYLAAQEGLLYPALHRLERRGLLAAEWQPGEGGPRRKYYRLTSRGQSALAESLREWWVFRERLTSLLEGVAYQSVGTPPEGLVPRPRAALTSPGRAAAPRTRRG